MSNLNTAATPKVRASAKNQKRSFDKAPIIVTSPPATQGSLPVKKHKQIDQDGITNATSPLASTNSPKIELPELNAQKSYNNQQQMTMPFLGGVASNTISPTDRTTLRTFNNLPTSIENSSSLVSPHRGSIEGRKAQQYYDEAGSGYLNHPSIIAPASQASIGANSSANGFVQSHRMSTKIRGHLMAYQQQVPSAQGASSKGLFSKLKSQQTKSSLKPEGTRAQRRNQSPLITVVNNTTKGVDPQMKQSKTRNNLQQHVVSNQSKQVVVGQPYISFKNEKQSSQLGRINQKPKHMDQLDRRELVLKQQLAEGGNGKSRYLNMQQARSNRPSRLHPSGISIDSDLSHQQLNQQHSRQYLFVDQQNHNKRKSSFSYSSNIERDWQTQRRPSVWNGHHQNPLHSDQRMVEEASSSTNCVINVLGPVTNQPKSVQTTMASMNPNKSHRKYISKQAPAVVSQGGRPSPKKFPPMTMANTKAATGTQKNNKSTEAIEYVDQPIAISDQEEIKLPQSMINSDAKKHSLTGYSVYDSINNGELQNYQEQPDVLKLSQQNNNSDGQKEGIQQIQIIGSPNATMDYEGKRTLLKKVEQEDQSQYQSPRLNNPSQQWNESRSQVEIPNLSTYQSQAIVSRRRTQGYRDVKQTQPLMEQESVLDTANNVLTQKSMAEDSYSDDDDYGIPSHAEKSGLSLRDAALVAHDEKNEFRSSQRCSKDGQASVFGKNAQTGTQHVQQSQKRFTGRDSQKIIPVLNTRYQNQTDSKPSPNQRDRSISSNQKQNIVNNKKIKGTRNSVQQQKEMLHQAYLADLDPQKQLQSRKQSSSHIQNLLHHQQPSQSTCDPTSGSKNASNIIQSQKKPNKVSKSNSTDSLGVKSRFQTKKQQPGSNMKTNTAQDTADSFMRIRQQESVSYTPDQHSDKPYTEVAMVVNSAGVSDAIDAPDILGCELTGTSQDESAARHKTPTRRKRGADIIAKKQLNGGGQQSNAKMRRQQQPNVAHLSDGLPYVQAIRNQQKSFQTIERKQVKTKSALSPMPVPHGAVKFHHVSNEGGASRIDRNQDKDGLSTVSSQVELKDRRVKDDGRNSKTKSFVGTIRRKKLASNAASATAGSKKQQSVSPTLREKIERSNKNPREGKRKNHIFSPNDYCMNASVGLSSSVTSLPRIISEDRQGNVPLRNQKRRLVSQVPPTKFATSKSTIEEHSLSSHDNNKQYLSSRLNIVAPFPKCPSNQPMLSPIEVGKPLSQVKINKALKKSIKSSSVLKIKSNETDSRLPKLKKQVSIREHSLDESPSIIGSNSDSASLEHNMRRNKRRQGTPMSIMETNTEMQEVEAGNMKIQIPDLQVLAVTKHTKSNSQAFNSTLHAAKNQMVNSNNATGAGGQTTRAKQPSNDAGSGPRDQRSLSTTMRESNKGLRNKVAAHANTVGRSVTTDESTGLMGMSTTTAEHQIRIEISKTEVLDSMKKEHQKDLSLLFYDFNNSKARLMSKMKKMSDFVIQEENAEADGDGAAAPPNEEHALRKKQGHTISIKDKSRLSPVSKKHLSPHGSDKTKSTLTKIAGRVNETNKKREGLIDHFPPAPQASASKGSNSFITSQPAFEASLSIKQLDLPTSTFKNAGKLSTTDVTQIQTEMDFVNKKIDKAKQSISQLQNEGGIKAMNLQSTARLVNSRNSSTHTLQQQAQQITGTPDLTPMQDHGLSSNKNTMSSPNMKEGKKIFLFNQSTVVKENFDARNRSPCFGSVKNSQHILPNSTGRHLNSIDNITNLAEQYSHSLSSLRQQSHHGSANKYTPFPQPQNGLVALSRRSDQSLNDMVVQTQHDIGCTGATAGELESNLSNHAVLNQNMTKNQQNHGGIGGTGYQTSATNDYGKSSGKKQRQNIAGNFNRRLPSMTLGSPTHLKKQRSRKASRDTSNDGTGKVMNTESDYAIHSSQHDMMMSERDSESEGNSVNNEQDNGGVHSIIAYVKENKQIWE